MVLLIVRGITSAELESSHTNGPDDNTYPSSIPGSAVSRLIGHTAGLHFILSQRLSGRLIPSRATRTDAFRIPSSPRSLKDCDVILKSTDAFLAVGVLDTSGVLA